jgi:phosphoribosylglycinamide formyltransferase-1
MIKVAIFASGAGTNAKRIIDYFGSRNDISIDLVVTNRSKAGVIDLAKQANKEVWFVPKKEILDAPSELVSRLKNRGIEYIVLAGYLLKIPSELINAYAGRMLNIHPSLLPSFGGAGMYGDYVHKAVIDAKKTTSGITIHEVNEEFDQGRIVFQQGVELDEGETIDTLKLKIRALEHRHFPEVIEKFISENKK